MSLRFYFGPSGSGKSRQLYEEILSRAVANPRQNFLVLVPDQFTMQTQKDFVMLSDREGIMNIDVLSFGRLSHRILEEVGWENMPVLDDTGKSLVLQRVVGGIRDKLPVLGSFLSRQGYIHEVKSAISEFMQYGVGTADMDRLIQYASGRGALVYKLKDLQTIYTAFTEYIGGHYITTEEKLDVLARSLAKSRLIKDSVVVFDGFTGFTPIQNRLIMELMAQCEELIVSLSLGEGVDPYQCEEEQKLFYLTQKTVADLQKLAKRAGVSRGEDVFLQMHKGQKNRFTDAPALAHLERNLFRYPYEAYPEKQNTICLSEALNPREEVYQTGLEICRLIRRQKLAYKDIAIICGDLESYAPYVESIFARMQIPCYVDRTRGLLQNPMIEYIKSALALFEKDFSYAAVFHYLRSGLADFTKEEVDLLEEYCIRTGMRGYRNFSRKFVRKASNVQEENTLSALDTMREQMMDRVEMLHVSGRISAAEYVERLYDFLVQNEVQKKLVHYEEQFEAEGNYSRAREYAQIYRLVMELLEQIHELLGDELITVREFADLLESGFNEIEVGTIPQNVDRVIVGDMERTRIKQVKVLFFLGVNDGNIPRNTSKGGIISDMDREYLREAEIELAPSPRQQMYIQRLYLYLNMTKPSGRLYVSYSKVNSAGKSLRPAYLIDTLKELFPGLKVHYPETMRLSDQLVNPLQGREILAKQLRSYVEGSLSGQQQEDFFTVYQVFGQDPVCRDRLESAAFKRYQESALSRTVAHILYGQNLLNSISRLETFAACAYRHFLQYGLSLREREEFGFEKVDLGNIYHAVLESFGNKLQAAGQTWFDFPKEAGEQYVHEAVEECAASYGETVLYSTARLEYLMKRMERVLNRTVSTLQEQFKKGIFQPEEYEVSFRFAEDPDSIRIRLSDEEKMTLQGRIDRIDTAEDREHVYVKVVDYKSGNRKFDLVALYYGLQLQLVVYMNAALELEKKKNPDKEIVPAALLYYHVDDPVLEVNGELSDEEIEQALLKQLRMNGVVNSNPEIIEKMDRYMEASSSVLPVDKLKSGAFSSRSSVMSSDQLRVLSDYVNHKLKDLGSEMFAGKITVNPYERGTENACTYCAYKAVCGYDNGIPGYHRRDLPDIDKTELLSMMEKEVE